jgi:hypothetical protein
MGTSVAMIEHHYGHLLAPPRHPQPPDPRRDLGRIWTQTGRKPDRLEPPAQPIPLNHAENTEAL